MKLGEKRVWEKLFLPMRFYKNITLLKWQLKSVLKKITLIEHLVD